MDVEVEQIRYISKNLTMPCITSICKIDGKLPLVTYFRINYELLIYFIFHFLSLGWENVTDAQIMLLQQHIVEFTDCQLNSCKHINGVVVVNMSALFQEN